MESYILKVRGNSGGVWMDGVDGLQDTESVGVDSKVGIVVACFRFEGFPTNFKTLKENNNEFLLRIE
tara:strand:- start:293 stop:493 length:201 start_codon:yes stop_codon:yes gene_type:complete